MVDWNMNHVSFSSKTLTLSSIMHALLEYFFISFVYKKPRISEKHGLEPIFQMLSANSFSHSVQLCNSLPSCWSSIITCWHYVLCWWSLKSDRGWRIVVLCMRTSVLLTMLLNIFYSIWSHCKRSSSILSLIFWLTLHSHPVSLTKQPDITISVLNQCLEVELGWIKIK